MSKKMKNYTWEMIRDIYLSSVDAVNWEKSAIGMELRNVPEKYRPGLASAFSAIKWMPGNPRRGEGPCGLCIQFENLDDWLHECGNCPLVQRGVTCNEYASLFDMADDERVAIGRNNVGDMKAYKGAMDRLYKTLLKIYKKEWEKI